jgi:hypothetical protein
VTSTRPARSDDGTDDLQAVEDGVAPGRRTSDRQLEEGQRVGAPVRASLRPDPQRLAVGGGHELAARRVDVEAVRVDRGHRSLGATPGLEERVVQGDRLRAGLVEQPLLGLVDDPADQGGHQLPGRRIRDRHVHHAHHLTGEGIQHRSGRTRDVRERVGVMLETTDQGRAPGAGGHADGVRADDGLLAEEAGRRPDGVHLQGGVRRARPAFGHVDALVRQQQGTRVRDRVVAETRGNPLALLELVRAMSEAELSGGFAHLAVTVTPGLIEQHYVEKVESLPEATRRLLLLAAADATGDATLLWRSAQALGLGHDALEPAREQLRAAIDPVSTSGGRAPQLLLKAARCLESLDPELAKETYLDAWGAAVVAGQMAAPGASVTEVSAAARTVCPASEDSPEKQPRDLLLQGLTTLVLESPERAAPSLRRAVAAYLADDSATEEWLHSGVLIGNAALTLWDFDAWDAATQRHVQVARRSGALAQLAPALTCAASWTCGAVTSRRPAR